MSLKCIGIDIGGTSVKLGIFEEDGTLVKKWEVPTRKEEDGKYILGDIAASIRRTVKESRLELSDFSGAGMGFPGPVLPDGHCEVCVNLGWKAGNPQQELSRLLDGMPVKSGNDANVAALGEMWQGGGKGHQDVVMITLGTGVGGGIIREGRIVAGINGAGGGRERALQLWRPWLPGAGCFRDRDRENCKKNAGGGQPSIQPQKLKEYQREECAGCSKSRG